MYVFAHVYAYLYVYVCVLVCGCVIVCVRVYVCAQLQQRHRLSLVDSCLGSQCSTSTALGGRRARGNRNSGMGKRGSGGNSAHLAQKKNKLASQLEAQEELEDSIQFRKDLKQLESDIKENPELAKKKLRRAQQAVAVVVVTPENSAMLSSDLEGRRVKHMPRKFLKDEFLLAVEDKPAPFCKDENIVAMLKKEKNSLIHILCRLATVSEDDPHGPQEKKIWLGGYVSRIKNLGGWPVGLMLKSDMSLDWDNGGHFQLMPKMEADAKPAEHLYKAFTMMGRKELGPLEGVCLPPRLPEIQLDLQKFPGGFAAVPDQAPHVDFNCRRSSHSRASDRGFHKRADKQHLETTFTILFTILKHVLQSLSPNYIGCLGLFHCALVDDRCWERGYVGIV